VRVGIPPPFLFVPAALAGFCPFGAIFLGFFTAGSVMNHRFREVMVSFVRVVQAIRRCPGRSESYQASGGNQSGGNFCNRGSQNLQESNPP
jgi:hypothetical protein